MGSAPDLPMPTEAALERFKAALTARFADRLRELVLFGSVARREATEDSDVDVLVVIDALTPDEKDRVLELAYQTAVDADGDWCPVVPLVMSTRDAAHLRGRERRIMHEIARDGIAL